MGKSFHFNCPRVLRGARPGPAGRVYAVEKKEEALALLAETFGVQPKDPFDRVKALQAAFDPSVLEFSDEYYDTLGLENPRHPEEQDINTGCDVAATQVIMMKKEDTREKSQDHRLENHPG